MKQSMKINKETASRLWVKQFGKKQKAVDFSGRMIARAAYNDRNSEYGWNVDHILPESRGGKTADHNLICCHILTNDEKADKFPCFNANGRKFEIQKRQNHYEIISKTYIEEDDAEENAVNFFDVSQGLRLWKQCWDNGQKCFVGYVKIRVTVPVGEEKLFERYRQFISELFCTDFIFFEQGSINICIGSKPGLTSVYTIIFFNISSKDVIQDILDNCVVLNTYSNYFINKIGFQNINIVCGMESYDNCYQAMSYYIRSILGKSVPFSGKLVIDNLVRLNTNAEDDLKCTNYIGCSGSFYDYNYCYNYNYFYDYKYFYDYNYTYTKLEKALEKRI